MCGRKDSQIGTFSSMDGTVAGCASCDAVAAGLCWAGSSVLQTPAFDGLSRQLPALATHLIKVGEQYATRNRKLPGASCGTSGSSSGRSRSCSVLTSCSM